jgi:integrase/recombinase XerD
MHVFHNLNYPSLCEHFIREKQYLANVSPATVAGYRWAWKAFAPVFDGTNAAQKPDLLARIAALREGGLSPVTVNTYLRSFNTFFAWLHREGHLPTLMKVPRLKEEKKLITAFSAEQIERLISFRPRTLTERRQHALSCLILDTGIRINEALSLTRTDVDYGSLAEDSWQGQQGADGAYFDPDDESALPLQQGTRARIRRLALLRPQG